MDNAFFSINFSVYFSRHNIVEDLQKKKKKKKNLY